MYFNPRMARPLLLMTSFLVSIELTITELVSKSAQAMNKQLLKTSGADVLCSRKKKNSETAYRPGGGIHSSPPCTSEG